MLIGFDEVYELYGLILVLNRLLRSYLNEQGIPSIINELSEDTKLNFMFFYRLTRCVLSALLRCNAIDESELEAQFTDEIFRIVLIYIE